MRPKEDLPLIDLSCWNLTIPVNAETIPTKKLLAGYQSPFFQKQFNGALTFIAPSTGENIKPTKNSTYPRSEFRETNPDGTLVWWIPGEGYHTLFGDLQVDSLAEDLKGIYGQFHGKGTNVPVKVQLTGTTLFIQLRPIYTPDEIKDGDPRYPEFKLPILEDYKLGTRVTYKVELNPLGQLSVWVNGILKVRAFQFDMASYRAAYKGEGDRWYAKAGVYSQTRVGKKGIGRATFYALTIKHTQASSEQPNPPVTEQPSTPEPTQPTTPAERVLADLSRAVAEILAKVQAGTLAVAEALATIEALKVEADTKFAVSKERSVLYKQIIAARDSIRKPTIPAVPSTPTQPAEPETPTLPAEPGPTAPPPAEGITGIKAKLTQMEDLLDQIPEATAVPFRHLIDDVRRLVA